MVYKSLDKSIDNNKEYVYLVDALAVESKMIDGFVSSFFICKSINLSYDTGTDLNVCPWSTDI